MKGHESMKKLIPLLLALCLLAPMAALGQTSEMEALLALPGKQHQLHDLGSLTVEKVVQLTGEDSPNKTLSRFGVWGTDLGSIARLDGRYYMFGGNTFASERHAHWRSNVLFIIEDEDPTDGLTIVDAVKDKQGRAKELLLSLKQDKVEMTVIPTNLFAANGKLYCIYMSVSQWGPPGRWDARYSGLAVSEDGGQKWTKLQDVRWPGDSNFIQTANVLVGDTIYIWGIPGGRYGGVALMKVQEEALEDFTAYQYFTGLNEEGLPQWVQGEEGIAQAQVVIPGPVGEISVIYNEYLGNFIITYLKETAAAIVMQEGLLPWGEWGPEVKLARGADYPSLYGAYMHPDLVVDKGKSVFFTMSQFFPIYNIMWMRMDLP